MCACLRVCVRECVFACMCACVRVTHSLLLPLRLQEGGHLHQPQLGGADGAALPGRLPVRLGGARGLIACVTPEKDPASHTAQSPAQTRYATPLGPPWKDGCVTSAKLTLTQSGE